MNDSTNSKREEEGEMKMRKNLSLVLVALIFGSSLIAFVPRAYATSITWEGWWMDDKKITVAFIGESVTGKLRLAGETSGHYRIRIMRDIEFWPDEEISILFFDYDGEDITKSLRFTPTVATDEENTKGYHMDLCKDEWWGWSEKWTMDSSYPPRLHVYRFDRPTGGHWAALISGGFNPENNAARYWNDIGETYEILTSTYAYDASNIFVLYADGNLPSTSNCDNDEDGYENVLPYDTPISFSATEANIATVCNIIAGDPTASNDDTLFVFCTDHGVDDPVRMALWGEKITPSVFADSNHFGKITKYSVRVFAMEQCFSGGFIPSLSAPKTVLCTAAAADRESVGGIPFDPWCRDFGAALKGEQYDGTSVDADENDDGMVSIVEAFNYAYTNKDPSDTPQYDDNADGVSNTGLMPRDEDGYLGTQVFLGRTPHPSSPLDVYMLVDLSGSFADDLPVFKVQAPNMISNLKAAYPGARFGLGKFEDYPIHPFGDAASGDKAYERIIDLTFDTDAVLSCISSLFTRYGEDGPQSQLPALYQAATGAGQDLSGVGFPGASIPPGQQANFRDGAAKLFILWTDAPFHNPGDPGTIPYPGPSFDQTVEAIKALDPPMVIGISSGSGGVADLRRMAAATGALAPVGGVDTNGDGIIDIMGGEPLVCAISPSGVGIAEAIEALVGAAAVLPIADANGPYEGEVGKPIVLDGSGSFDSDGYIVLYEWDFDGDEIFDFSSTEGTASHIYATAFTGVVILRVTDNEGNTDTDEASIAIVQTDNIPPETWLAIGDPKYMIDEKTSLTSATSLTLSADDNPGGTGVASTSYRICNATYGTGWLEYSALFYLLGLSDGEYFIDYYSTDKIGNAESANTATVILDNTPPTTTLTVGEPKYVPAKTYVTPDTSFTLEATDTGSGVYTTAYRIYDAAYDSGWQTYTTPFKLTSLTGGTYTIEYNSTDNVQNTETKHAINVTLFSWNCIFEDTLGRGTTLKVNTEHGLFQFVAPDANYGLRNATHMFTNGNVIRINHDDGQLRIIAVAVSGKLDVCIASAYDRGTDNRYLLVDKAGVEVPHRHGTAVLI